MNLLLSPHNDDETLFGAFLLLRHEPHVIVCLRSARMGTPGYPEPLIDAETREAETERAMNVLGLEWTQWPHLDSAPDWDEVAAHMELTRRMWGEPLQVFAPAVEENGHDQHSRIGELADEIFGAQNVTHYLTYTRTGGRSQYGEPVPFEREWLPLKLEALACYESQRTHPMTQMWFDGDQTEYVSA